METPSGIKQAVIAILATLAISTLLALYQKLTGNATRGQFIITIMMYAFFCILPYKISKGSNAARYVYLVLDIFILYRLFQKDASNWFLSKR